jgi:endonuclease YncB( thermonuclease family)
MSIQQLKLANIKHYNIFSFCDLITKGKVVKNYDGDTIDLLFINNYDNIIRVKARLYGYDAPEKRPLRNDPDRINKIKKAEEAQQRLWELCTKCNSSDSEHETIVNVWCHNFDKYGRLLVTLYDDSITIDTDNEDKMFELSINYQMINEGHGYAYYGGTKK